LVRVPDFIYLSESAKDSLRISWLSTVAFNQIKEEQNMILLDNIWKNLKICLYPYFEGQAISFDDIIDSFGKITLTLNPSVTFGYNTERDVFVYQLWGFLFDLFSDGQEWFAVPAFPAKLAGEFVHEYDRYLFVKDKALIGEKIAAEYVVDMEKRASISQIAFLESCRENVPPRSVIEQIKVTEWLPDGKPVLDPACSSDMISRSQLVAFIDDHIRMQKQKLIEVTGEIKSALEQTDFTVADMIKVLSLPIEIDRHKDTYPEIEIEL
jgi:hypothetical protein